MKTRHRLHFTDQQDWMNPVKETGWFNAFEVIGAGSFTWPIATYKVTSETQVVDHTLALRAAWEAKLSGNGQTKGYGFIVEASDTTVAVPADWHLDEESLWAGCRLRRLSETQVRADRPEDLLVVGRILKEAIKERFKKAGPATFGPLWRDYRAFCQMPRKQNVHEGHYDFCRRFDFDVKPLAGGRWAAKFMVGTATIDHRSIADYYNKGEVEWLAEMVDLKRSNRLNRRSREVEIRVWEDRSNTVKQTAEVLAFKNPEMLAQHAKLYPMEQRALAEEKVECLKFGKPVAPAPKGKLFLILDSQITGQDHRETILEPDVRMQFAAQMRSVVNECDAFGHKLVLASDFLAIDDFDPIEILPPSIYVNGPHGTEVLQAPKIFSPGELKQRTSRRAEMIRQYGFVTRRTFNPVLVYPEQHVCPRSAEAIRTIVNKIWSEQGVDFVFERAFAYQRPDQIKRIVEDDGYDGVLVILPESSRRPAQKNDTHEKIKKIVSAPSQCVHLDNAIPERFAGRSLEEMRRVDSRRLQRVSRTLHACLDNLLVKANCIPFVPADPFHYNVHFGIDVGGRANNRVMACLGHGFARPGDGIIYRPFEIPMDSNQAEPIHPDALFNGLIQAMEGFYEELVGLGITPDFSSVLVMRDGALLGAGDEWNEIDALRRLHAEALDREWIGVNAVWTAAEIMKHAEGWRIVEPGHVPTNPTVGRCCFPFPDQNTALVSTTGLPYLTQGTASPLKIRLLDIAGKLVRVKAIRDIVWEADMCYTKPDMGEKLPWALQVADAGALQSARSYQLTGITV